MGISGFGGEDRKLVGWSWAEVLPLDSVEIVDVGDLHSFLYRCCRCRPAVTAVAAVAKTSSSAFIFLVVIVISTYILNISKYDGETAS